jgi:hypothetical protein
MKLCPLFQTLRDKPWCHITTIERVQRELPREAMEAAIAALQQCDEARDYPTRDIYANYIEQLRALIPQDHADLTASDSELHGGGMDE